MVAPVGAMTLNKLKYMPLLGKFRRIFNMKEKQSNLVA
jgi:hypothetical protein